MPVSVHCHCYSGYAHAFIVQDIRYNLSAIDNINLTGFTFYLCGANMTLTATHVNYFVSY
jgi:hypothetical protein